MGELNAERIAREVGADETMVSEILTRLNTVRGDLSDAGFAQLIRDVVKTKLSFAERDAREDLSVIRTRPRDD
jgi:SLT domain-containing protein